MSEVQLVRGKDIENYLQNSKVDTTVDRVRSKSKEDRAFALKLDNHFCPTTIHITGQTVLSSFRAKLSASSKSQ